mgnify:CR=1 FL=1
MENVTNEFKNTEVENTAPNLPLKEFQKGIMERVNTLITACVKSSNTESLEILLAFAQGKTARVPSALNVRTAGWVTINSIFKCQGDTPFVALNRICDKQDFNNPTDDLAWFNENVVPKMQAQFVKAIKEEPFASMEKHAEIKSKG